MSPMRRVAEAAQHVQRQYIQILKLKIEAHK